MDSLYLLTGSIAEKVSVPEDQIRMLLSLILCIPLGLIFRLLPSRHLRDIVGTLFGISLQAFVYGSGIFITFLQTGITYVLILILKRKAAKVVFIECLLFQSIYHIYRQVVDYGGWKLDITTVLMMYTCKYTSFAFCYADGGKSDEKLSQDQKQRKIAKLPNPLSYISYIYFFSGCLIGPSYDFVEYRDFIHKRNLYSKVPFTLVPVIKNILISAFCMALIVLVAPKYPLEFCGTDDYGALPFYQQFIYFNLAITVARMRYYTGWTMCQSGLDATGFSYGGTDKEGRHSWDNILTADPWLEFLASPKEKIDKWNSSVAAWLRRYVYFRIYSEDQIKKSAGLGVLAQNGTYLVSALWHGFYPSYYIAFIHWGFVSTLARYFFKASMHFPKFNFKNPIYLVIRWIAPNFMLNFYGIAFLNLSFSTVLKFFNNSWWIPNIVLYLLMIFFTTTGFGQRSPKGKEKNGENQKKQD